MKILRLKDKPVAKKDNAMGGGIITSLPADVAEICDTMVKTQFYNQDYVVASVLAAASAAIGNALSLQLLPGWDTNAALFTMLVGRAGAGKTPPMKTALAPIYAHDSRRVDAYMALPRERRSKARLEQTVVNDFTPEAMIRAHQNNPRGIVAAVDEVMGMFNSAARYNASPMVEQILSSFSGAPLKVNRVSDPEPIVISHPCISIIGTVQTARLHEFFRDEFVNIGLVDRFLFACPQDQAFTPEWDIDIISRYGSRIEDNLRRWDAVVSRLMELPYTPGEPHRLVMTDDAAALFCTWRNIIVSERDLGDTDDTRPDKRPLMVGKIALILHALAWATSAERDLGPVQESDIAAAISISDWYESSLVRARAAAIRSRTRGQASMADMLDMLGDDFTSKDLYAYADMLGMSKSVAYRQLNRMIDEGIVRRISNGNYQKALRSAAG